MDTSSLDLDDSSLSLGNGILTLTTGRHNPRGRGLWKVGGESEPAERPRGMAAHERLAIAERFDKRRHRLLVARVSQRHRGVALQHGFAAIEAGAAQQWSRGEGVRVAIIDTGVEVGHPDLVGRVAAARNFIDNDMSSFETDRHGTGVAGIIGADANNNIGIVGVAPSARLQIYKACQPLQPNGLEAQCNSFTLALALDAAIAAHAQIVNLSLGGPADPLLAQLVSYGQRRGMIFVGAVPDDGRLDGFPLGIPGVIAVDQVGRSDASAAVLHAPGRDILSLAPAGGYDFATGSSFAAAHVTGAIALLRARVPNLDAAMLFAVLNRTRTHDEHGDRINICAALAAVQPRDDCTHSARAVATATFLQ